MAPLWRSRQCSALIDQIYVFSVRFITGVVLVTYTVLYGPLSAARIFPLFTFFNLICDTVLNDLAWGVQTWLHVGVSVRRIEVLYQICRYFTCRFIS